MWNRYFTSKFSETSFLSTVSENKLVTACRITCQYERTLYRITQYLLRNKFSGILAHIPCKSSHYRTAWGINLVYAILPVCADSCRPERTLQSMKTMSIIPIPFWTFFDCFFCNGLYLKLLYSQRLHQNRRLQLEFKMLADCQSCVNKEIRSFQSACRVGIKSSLQNY